VYREIQEANRQAAGTSPADLSAAVRALSPNGSGRVVREDPQG
jgi:hypothetical protein